MNLSNLCRKVLFEKLSLFQFRKIIEEISGNYTKKFDRSSKILKKDKY